MWGREQSVVITYPESFADNDFTAKRVLYRRDRRVRRALLKKISALSAFSAMSFCSGLI
jgi:hypothetical protein